MIFVTVGSMLPFERMVRSVDLWASKNPQLPVFAQIGNGEYEPKHVEWARKVPGREYKARISESSLVVAHAGIGSIFTAYEFGKPLLLVPRYADTKEHTTDHQLHTAKFWRDKPNIVVAERDDVFDDKLEEALRMQTTDSSFSPFAPAPFLQRIREAILS